MSQKEELPRLSPAAEALEGSGIRKVMSLAYTIDHEDPAFNPKDPDHHVIQLEVGQPDFATPDHIVEATVAAAQTPAGQRYIANAGLPELRKAVADRFTERGKDTSVDQIIVTHGCMFSMATALMSTLAPGDEVLIPDPGFPNYTATVRMNCAVPMYYPCRPENAWLPDPDELATHFTTRTKLLMLSTPGNPTGAVIPKDLMERLLQVAHEHNVFVLSDEVYTDLCFEGEPAFSAANASNFDEDRDMVVGGVSKSYAMTGWRVGWLRAPRRIIDVACKIQEAYISCGTAFAQHGALAALTGPRSAIDDMLAVYKRRRDLACAILAENDLHDYTPGGAFYLLIRCGCKSSEFATALINEDHVAVAPGDTFGRVSEGYVRISFASSDEDVAEGVRRLCRAIKKQQASAQAK